MRDTLRTNRDYVLFSGPEMRFALDANFSITYTMVPWWYQQSTKNLIYVLDLINLMFFFQIQ